MKETLCKQSFGLHPLYLPICFSSLDGSWDGVTRLSSPTTPVSRQQPWQLLPRLPPSLSSQSFQSLLRRPPPTTSPSPRLPTTTLPYSSPIVSRRPPPAHTHATRKRERETFQRQGGRDSCQDDTSRSAPFNATLWGSL